MTTNHTKNIWISTYKPRETRTRQNTKAELINDGLGPVMTDPQSRDLGTLVSVHGTSPAYLQRAAIVAVLSFFFFMAMLVVFYLSQQIVYFILSTAFLVVYIFTLVGWVMQKRRLVSIYEEGVTYRHFSARWDEMKSVRASREEGISLTRDDGLSVTIPKSVANFAQIAIAIRSNLSTEP